MYDTYDDTTYGMVYTSPVSDTFIYPIYDTCDPNTIISDIRDPYGNRVITYADGRIAVENTVTINNSYDMPRYAFSFNDYKVAYADKASAERAVGFSVKLPATVNAVFPYTEYKTINNSILQVKFTDGFGHEVVIRKAAGRMDISGDDEYYPYVNNEMIGFAPAVVCGNYTGYYKGIACNNGYSVSVETNYGMTVTEMENVLAAIV